MGDETIASAITVPEPIEPPPDTTNNSSALKRRGSELPEHEQDGKRQRLSPGKTPPIKATSPEAESREREKSQAEPATGEAASSGGGNNPPDAEESREASRRKSSTIAEEKQRSKRLFGALLGNLNRPASGDRTNKRRQEIEERRKAELRRQDERDVRDQQDNRSRLVEQRRRQKVNLDEHNMRIRHRNLRDAANYLKTQSKPQVYYRPWDLRPDEEDRIDDQIKAADEQIDKELEDFKNRDRQPRDQQASDDNAHAPNDTYETNDTHEQSDNAAAPESNAEEPTEPTDTDKESDGKDGEKSASVVLVSEEQSQPANVPNISTSDSADPAPDANKSDPTGSAAAPEESAVDAREDAEEDEDHVVEGDEDTVIY